MFSKSFIEIHSRLQRHSLRSLISLRILPFPVAHPVLVIIDKFRVTGRIENIRTSFPAGISKTPDHTQSLVNTPICRKIILYFRITGLVFRIQRSIIKRIIIMIFVNTLITLPLVNRELFDQIPVLVIWSPIGIQ